MRTRRRVTGKSVPWLREKVIYIRGFVIVSVTDTRMINLLTEQLNGDIVRAIASYFWA